MLLFTKNRCEFNEILLKIHSTPTFCVVAFFLDFFLCHKRIQYGVCCEKSERKLRRNVAYRSRTQKVNTMRAKNQNDTTHINAVRNITKQTRLVLPGRHCSNEFMAKSPLWHWSKRQNLVIRNFVINNLEPPRHQQSQATTGPFRLSLFSIHSSTTRPVAGPCGALCAVFAPSCATFSTVSRRNLL